MSQSSDSNLPVVFLAPDNPQNAALLAEALRAANQSQVIGLVIKVDPSDQVVNWFYADPNFVKSISLVMPATSNSSEE
jgi:hypothetical protein